MMDENRIRSSIAQSLSTTCFPDARKKQVFDAINGGKPVKKKISLALVCAIMLTLLFAGAALAAVLGVFGRMNASPYDAQKLSKLDQSASVLDLTVPLEAPISETAAPVQTDYDTILSRQQERTFELTLSQTYYDGKKLYYSYTLKTNGAQSWQGEGMPTGVTEWLMEESDKRYAEVWSNDIPGRDKEITVWLDSHESSWIAHENWGLGDGAITKDGAVLDIIGGDSEMLDACTLQGWQEVALPHELADLDELTVELSVLYGASLYHQDETGVRWAHIAQNENRGILRIPFTVYKNGQTSHLHGNAAFADYAAKTGLTVSDVEISGKVILKVPKVWTDTLTDRIENANGGDVILDYHLMADGQMLRNHNCSLHTPLDGRLEITVAFDLPKTMNELVLIPEYAKAGIKTDEGITLLEGEAAE